MLFTGRRLDFYCSVVELEIVGGGAGTRPASDRCVRAEGGKQVFSEHPQFGVKAPLALSTKPIRCERREQSLPSAQPGYPRRDGLLIVRYGGDRSREILGERSEDVRAHGIAQHELQ